MRARLVLENSAPKISFQQDYFKLPYITKETRLAGSEIESHEQQRFAKDMYTRDMNKDYSKVKYDSPEDFVENANLNKVEKQVEHDVKEVMSFVSNNPLTKNLLKPEWYKIKDVKEYFSDENRNDERSPLGIIETQLDLVISVDFDLYKGVTVFTFAISGMFYYYTVFTLGRNDVLGAGEDNTYITVSDLKREMFYETMWRWLFYEINQGHLNNYFSDLEELSKALEFWPEEIKKFDNYNLPHSVVDGDYFDYDGFYPMFSKLIHAYENPNWQPEKIMQQDFEDRDLE